MDQSEPHTGTTDPGPPHGHTVGDRHSYSIRKQQTNLL